MVSYVKNYIQDQAMGYLHTGITAAGTMAGNAVGGVGGLIESGGRSIGEGTSGSISGVGGSINNYGDGIRNKFAADGYVGASASQKAKREPSEASKPYGMKGLPDAGAAGAYVTNASRKVLPGSAQPKPSAAATKQVRSAGSKPVGATKTPQKALPAPATGAKKPLPAATGAPKGVTGAARAPSAASKPKVGPAAGRGPTGTPKPAPPRPASGGVTTGKKPVPPGQKTTISAASRPKATKKPVLS